MLNQFSRTELLLGKSAMDNLSVSTVAVFGIGGVGGHAVEALARSGVGSFVLFDDDKVSLTNINRQIVATMDTIGEYKVDVMKERIISINPNANVEVQKTFFMPENADKFDFTKYSYVIDAIDTITAKIELVMRANQAGVPIISSMGAGNKIDPTKFEITDIYKTSVCPLARVMRRELKARHIKKLKVVYSTEEAKKPFVEYMDEVCSEKKISSEDNNENKRNGTAKKIVPGSTAFVPSVAGLIIASEVIKDLSKL